MPGTPTPRFAIPTLAATDPINQGSSTISAALNAIDTAMAGYSQGTFAARPAAGTWGRFYRATNILNGGANGTLYWDDGMAWNEIPSAATAWTNLTLGTGITSVAVGNPNYTAAVRIDPGGSVIRLKGALYNNSGGTIAAAATLATIPTAGWRPMSPAAYAWEYTAFAGTTTAGGLTIATSGVISINVSLPTLAQVGLDGLTFTSS